MQGRQGEKLRLVADFSSGARPCITQLLFFITNKGAQITAEQVTMSFATLSEFAGYPKGFFSSHSRMVYGSRMAAKILSQGGNVQEIYGRLGFKENSWGSNHMLLSFAMSSSNVARFEVVDTSIQADLCNYEGRGQKWESDLSMGIHAIDYSALGAL